MASKELEPLQPDFRQSQRLFEAGSDPALQDPEILLSTLLDHLRSGVYFKDLQSRFVRINPAQARTLKLRSAQEAIGKSDQDFFTEEHAKEALFDEQKIIRTERPLLDKEEKETWSDGRITWVSTSKAPIRSRDGRVIGTFGISRDVTEKHRMHQALIESEKLLQELVTAIRDVFWIREYATGRTVYVSSAFEAVWGAPVEYLYANPLGWASNIPDGERSSVLEYFKEKSSEPFEISFRIRRADGEMRWIRHRSFPVFDSENRVVRVAGISSDFTESKQVSDEFAKTQRLLALIVNSSHDAIFSESLDGKITTWNRAAEEIFGYLASEVVGLPSEVLLAPGREHEKEWVREQIYGGHAVENLDTTLRHKDGHSVPVTFSALPVRDESGNVLGISTSVRDLSVKAELQEKLSTVEAQLRFVLEATSLQVLIVDHEWKLTYVNRPLHGASLEETIGKTLWNYQPALIGSSFEESYRAAMESQVSQRCEGRLPERNLWYESTAYPLPVGLLILVRDVTEKHATEDHLRRSQKLEAIGQLAAGIAHEINTPIQYVGDNTQFLKESWTQVIGLLELVQQLRNNAKSGHIDDSTWAQLDDAVREIDLPYLRDEVPTAIDQTLDGVKRVANIVRAMKEFSHPGSEEKQAVDLNKALQATVTITRNEWKYVADVELQLDAGLPMVVCLGGEINQVFLNLLVNAAHAIKEKHQAPSTDKGKITISTRHDNQWAEILIQDDGTGIPEDIRDRIFDPFFTTKEVGKGTGQGLSHAQAVIVKKHSGWIWCESEMGKGTTFFVRLPLSGKAQE